MRRWVIVMVVAVLTSTAAYVASGRNGDARPLPIVLVGSGTYRAAIECAEGFERGCDGRYPYTFGPGKPRWRVIVWLDAFWADRWLVRRESYDACRRAGACKGAQDRRREFPACNANALAWVAFDDARAFCAWRGWRLPTADEFERMARWTDGRRYAGGPESWGKQCDPRVSPDGLQELNLFDQWVTSPTGLSGIQWGASGVRAMSDGTAPFRCVRSFRSGPNPGKASVWPQQDDPWVHGGPDW